MRGPQDVLSLVGGKVKLSPTLLRNVGTVSSAGYVRRAFLFETFGITAQHWSERSATDDSFEIGVHVEIQRLDEQAGRREYDAVELRLYEPIFRADLSRSARGRPGTSIGHMHTSISKAASRGHECSSPRSRRIRLRGLPRDFQTSTVFSKTPGGQN